MTAKLKHVAIVSEQYALIGKFYEALFGLRAVGRLIKGENAMAMTDGYVGLNVNGRRAGGVARLDHYGFEVEDLEALFARVQERYPTVQFLKRLSTRPFAGLSTHDPAGNYFDISHRAMANRADVYADDSLAAEEYPYRVHHLMLRALDPDALCRFYTEVYELRELPKERGDPSHYLSDGRVTLVIAPWRIADYGQGNPEVVALDHLGFATERPARVFEDLERITRRNPYMRPMELGYGEEGESRLALLKTCRYGQVQLADPEGVLLDVCTG